MCPVCGETQRLDVLDGKCMCQACGRHVDEAVAVKAFLRWWERDLMKGGGRNNKVDYKKEAEDGSTG